jgi:hypothetical protein
MRYLLLTYYKKANGSIDEAMAVSRNLKPHDLQTCNVILDFKKLQVVQASMSGRTVPKDFGRIVDYYRQHYQSTIDRLLAENGYQYQPAEPVPDQTAVTAEEEEFLTAVTDSGQFTLDQAKDMYSGITAIAQEKNETDTV